MADTSTRVAVIGAGPGGYAAAFLAADLGMSVTLIDEEKNPGGVCLHRGCIPSKALLHVARLLDETRDAAAWGIEFGTPRVDLERLRAFKTGIVEKLTGGLGQLARQRKVDYVRGRAEILDPHTLSVATAEGTRRVSFDHAILATGSTPARIPNLPDDPRVIDSTGALDLADAPPRLLVVGGGYIGLELGTVYAALGSRVTVVEMTDGLLPGADRDLVNVLARRIGTRFEEILLSTKVTGVRAQSDGLVVSLAGPQGSPAERAFDKVLVAVGRKPNARIPGLERTKVTLTPRGFIEVDGQRRTAEPSLFAIGDVAGEPMLAHKASHEGRVAVEAIAGHKVAFEPAAIPAVVFTDPEIAWCGLTETRATEQGTAVEVARFPWGASGRALTLDRADGLTKLIIEPGTGRVLGMAVVGVGAGELIAEGVLAVEMAALASDVALSIHPHPTLSETVMESADAFLGTATHIYRPRRREARTSASREPPLSLGAP
jgi:dihydrolipoamide dehydrogenase